MMSKEIKKVYNIDEVMRIERYCKYCGSRCEIEVLEDGSYNEHTGMASYTILAICPEKKKVGGNWKKLFFYLISPHSTFAIKKDDF